MIAISVPPGEIHEYKEDLASLDKSKKKDAVKKVIAAMTVGKDVSMLFPHVVNCMQTDDLELKKLVYLYLINYAKTQPDLAIMGVNTFVKVGQGCNTHELAMCSFQILLSLHIVLCGIAKNQKQSLCRTHKTQTP